MGYRGVITNYRSEVLRAFIIMWGAGALKSKS